MLSVPFLETWKVKVWEFFQKGGKKVIKRVTYIAPEKEITEFFTKTNSRNTLTIAGLDIKKGYNPVNSQTTIILDSQKLTSNNIKEYAQQLAGTVPLKEVGNGDKQIYVATLGNGQKIRLRSVSSSASQTRARWTIDIQGNPGINNSLGLSPKEKVEIKYTLKNHQISLFFSINDLVHILGTAILVGYYY